MYRNEKRYALTNCVILDGSEHMEPQTGKAVCIDGEKINEIEIGRASCRERV